MSTQRILANASQVMVEQLVASGVRYLFNNPGSREALFFDALASNPRIHGVMALHEGSVAAMAGGYAQANLDPAVMSVHLGAGLAQSLGQLINVWSAARHRIPVLFVVPNNRAYGIVAGAFERAGGIMSDSEEYEGVALEKVDPVTIAEGYGVEGRHIKNESDVEAAISQGIDIVERERRPMVLNVNLLQGIPSGSRPMKPFWLGYA